MGKEGRGLKECSKWEELIFRSMDENLSEEEMKSLLAHISSCPACKKLYEDLHCQQDILRGLRQEDVVLPDGYHEKLMERIRAERNVVPLTAKKKEKKNHKSYWKSSAIAAAVFVFAIGTHMTVQIKQQQELKESFVVTAHSMDSLEDENSKHLEQSIVPEESNSDMIPETVPFSTAETEQPVSQQNTTQAEEQPQPKTVKNSEPAIVSNSATAADEAEDTSPENAADSTPAPAMSFGVESTHQQSIASDIKQMNLLTELSQEETILALQEAVEKQNGTMEQEKENQVLCNVTSENMNSFLEDVSAIGTLEEVSKADGEKESPLQQTEETNTAQNDTGYESIRFFLQFQ